MTLTLETLSFEHAAGIGRLQLRRPDQGNAIDLRMAHELREVAMACAHAADLRVVVLTAAGSHFCFGGDLRASAASGRPPSDYSGEITRVLHEAMLGFIALPAPVLVAVHGVAAGAGLGLALMGDLVIAARSARLFAAYTRVALTPDTGVSFMLPRLIGRARSMELLLLNRTLTAEEAQQWGLVNRVVDDAELAHATAEWAGTLAAGPAGAYGETKALVRASLAGLETQLAAESECMARRVATDEGAAGVAAFLANARK